MNKKTILTALLLITMFFNIMPISNATRLSGETNIYSIGMSDDLLLYKNGYFLTIFDIYENEGEQYPAYNALFPTYNYNNPYDERLIEEDSFLWKVVVNGYPYKSISELNCNSYAEAYTATQAAIYCAHCGHIESDYSYFEGNESSVRTYNAFLNILENAKNNQITTNKNNILKLVNLDDEWKYEDDKIYRTYSIKSNYPIEQYQVEIENFNNVIIADEENNIKSEFNKEEKFKVILPIEELKNSGELEIKITTYLETIPIYLGISPENAYVMTAPRYEKDIKTFSQTYQENLTSINIKVQELDTKIEIENSIVNLLNSNKEIISTLTTNEKGKIFIEHLVPGRYYIEQVTTEQGYNTYTKQIELNMDYNKIINLTINNAPTNVENLYNKEENIIVTEEKIEKNIKNDITNTNINNKTEITDENNKNSDYTENNETINKNINNDKTNTNINNKTEITNENNKNSDYTENNETINKNINNDKTNTNINNKTETTDENNKNSEYTENNETINKNMNNDNINTNLNDKMLLINSNTSNNLKSQGVSNTTKQVKKLPRTGM